MPRARRTLKGNKKRAVFDRLIVPQNDFQLPPPIRELQPEIPTEPVGQRCNITHVIIYEMHITYEGKPNKKVYRIKFSDIVGNPVTTEKLRYGYDLHTSQGEVITIKWHHNESDYTRSGLILHNKSASGTSYYEPNWGNVYGVGLEWIACDGSQSGVIWANRHLGYSRNEKDATGNNYPVPEYWPNSNVPPEYSPRAVRGGLMLGNPEPERTLWLMGQELPVRVFPAIGKIGEGVFLGFNRNVMAFVRVAPPIPPYFNLSGEGTARGDVIAINWRKEEFHNGYTRCGFQIVSDPNNLVTGTSPSLNPNNKGVTLTTQPTLAMQGSGGISQINFRYGAPGNVKVRFYLFETDASGEPIYTLECLEATWLWSTAGTCPVTKEYVYTNLPYPLKPAEVCAGVEPIETPPDIGGGEEELPGQTDIKYFCDNSVPVSSIDTTYWDTSLTQFGIRREFWDGRNDIINLFTSLDNSVDWYKGLLTPVSFHYYLWKLLQDNKQGNGIFIDNDDWQEFREWCNNNDLTCMTDLQKASLFCSYWLGVPVNFFSGSEGYLQGDILTVLVRLLSLLPRGIYDWIDFNDVITDSGGSITGAFAADIPSVLLGGFKSYVNFEPQALLFTIDSAIAHRPVDYIKPPGSTWGTETSVDWSSYNVAELNAQNYKPYVVGEVGIHEIGHAVSYYGLDYYGQILHERPDWLAISGWASKDDTHLSKSRPANLTGGMPLTDDNKEAPVSDYGCFSPAEDFAEAYRMYVINPVFLEDKYPQKYNFMVTVVEPMFTEG